MSPQQRVLRRNLVDPLVAFVVGFSHRFVNARQLRKFLQIAV